MRFNDVRGYRDRIVIGIRCYISRHIVSQLMRCSDTKDLV